MKKGLILIVLFASIELYAQSYMSFKKDAIKLFKDKKVEQSYKKTEDFIHSHPKSIRAKNLLATLYYWNKEYGKSKELLEEILAHSSFKESKKLYGYVQKKLSKLALKKGKNQKISLAKKIKKSPPKYLIKEETTHIKFEATKKSDVKKVAEKHTKKPSFKSLVKANQKEDLDEFDRLATLIESDPKDLKSRELLAKYYLKVGLYQRAYDFAREALVINPQNDDMKKIVKHLSLRSDIDTTKTYEKHQIVDIAEAKDKLKKLFENKSYTAYVNLYKALLDGGIKMSKKENENAIYSAINAGEFELAKKILAIQPLAHGKYEDRLNAMLLKK